MQTCDIKNRDLVQKFDIKNRDLVQNTCADKEDAASRMEIDFLIEKSTLTNAHNIHPIEVKSGKNYTTSSLNKFLTKFKEQSAQPYVIHSKDWEVKDGIIYMPFYMAGLL